MDPISFLCDISDLCDFMCKCFIHCFHEQLLAWKCIFQGSFEVVDPLCYESVDNNIHIH